MKVNIINVLFYCLLNVSLGKTSKSPSLYNLTTQSFDVNISKDPKVKWLIVFWVPQCNVCTKAVKMIEEEVVPYFVFETKVHFSFINCDDNVWLATRFNITMVPYIILIKNEKMVEMKNIPTKDSIMEFIFEMALENMKPIPKPFSYLNMLSSLMGELFYVVKENIQNQLDLYHISFIKWENYMTGILLFLAFILILLIEIIIFFICCNRKGNKPNIKMKENKVKTEEFKAQEYKKEKYKKTKYKKEKYKKHLKKD